MTEKLHSKPFDEGTRLKLNIFRKCFREWLPVFIHNPKIDKIFVYDFFAGPGRDSEGTPGSPLILLEEARGADLQYCKTGKIKDVIFGFNDKNESETLKQNIAAYFNQCCQRNCKKKECLYEKKCHCANLDFKSLFASENLKKILANKSFAKFILLDQYGFSQVDEEVFRKLAGSPMTDFIFFIASSFVDRFKDHEYTRKYLNTEKIDFSSVKPVQRHGLIADYFASLVNKPEFYLHHFTIRKGSNHYGLIFGTNHTYGMEKFLKVCWEEDTFAGESNDNKWGDEQEGSLFFGIEPPKKIEAVKAELREMLLQGKIDNNINGLKTAMRKRCRPKVFVEVVRQLEKEKKIERIGETVNNRAERIHEIPEYKIRPL